MSPTKKTNPPPKNPVADTPSDDQSLEAKDSALIAEILQLHKKATKEYATITSLQQQVRALQEANIDLHKRIPSTNEKLNSIAFTIVHPQVTCPACSHVFTPAKK